MIVSRAKEAKKRLVGTIRTHHPHSAEMIETRFEFGTAPDDFFELISVILIESK
jgi:hypothetical protein